METIKVTIRKNPKALFPERIDIIQNLPEHGIKSISKNLGCSNTSVSNVLHGRRSPVTQLNENILTLAQIMAAVNIWNQRFCKSQPTINPLKITI